MALTQTFDGKGKVGSEWITYGTWTATSVTGGDLNTHLRICNNMILGHTGSAGEAAVAVVNETMPGADGSAMTFVCSSGDAGIWIAIGIE